MSAKMPLRIPRKALEAVVYLAFFGKFDRWGEGTSLDPEDLDAIRKVCKAFNIKEPKR